MDNQSLNREGSPNGPREGAAPDARHDEAQRSAPINREESLDSGLSRSASELRGTIRYAHIDRVDGSTISEPGHLEELAAQFTAQQTVVIFLFRLHTSK